MARVASWPLDETPEAPGRYFNILFSWGLDFSPVFKRGYKSEHEAVQAINRMGADLAPTSIAVVGYDPNDLSPGDSRFYSWRALNPAESGVGYEADRNIGPIKRHMAGAMSLRRTELNRTD